jgi:crotonobetainyl-CoA:carnitine CoA-transferase CaiB-like acyl-CoA transferase
MGADIVKVESFRGDLTRSFHLLGVNINGETTSFLALNRNKRSIAIDLKTREGLRIVRRLVRSADVVIQNFRPGVADRLKIGYSDLSRINRRLVYVSISGYGPSGPLVNAPGQDLLVQSFSGMTFSAGSKDDPPHPAPTYVIDTCASQLATTGVLAALLQRSHTGKGQHVQTSLLAAALEIQCQEVMTYLRTGEAAPRSDAPYASAWLEPPYGVYQTADSWIALAQNDIAVIADAVESPQMAALAQAPPDRRTAPPGSIAQWRDTIHRALQSALINATTADWVRRLSERKVWCGPVYRYHESLHHEQTQPLLKSMSFGPAESVAGVGHVIEFSASPQLPLAPPPRLGEHTAELLREAGYIEEQIGAFKNQGVVR